MVSLGKAPVFVKFKVPVVEAAIDKVCNRFGELFEALSLSEGSGEYLHRRLYAELRQAILTGRVPAQSRLPSSRAFAQSLGLSRNTVNTALAQLTAEGYVRAKPGSGTFVADLRPSERAAVPRAAVERHAARVAIVPARRARMLEGAGSTLAELRYRYDSPPKPFRIGVPAIADFPLALWRRIVARAHRRIPQHALGDSDPAGLPQLRQAIIGYLSAFRGIKCEPEQLILTAGSQQALDLLVRVATDPGDTVLMEDPGYIGASGCFRAAGVRLKGLPIDAEGMCLPPKSWRSHPRLIYCTPSSQMPLGLPMTYARREALLAFAEQHSAWIIEDDYDGEYRYDSRPLPTLYSICETGRVIYLGTFSKTLFPGLRIGYAIVPPELVEAVTVMRFLTSWHLPALEQHALAEFIESGDFARHVRRSRARYRERAQAIFEAGKRWLPPSHAIASPASGLNALMRAPGTENHERRIRNAARQGIELSPLAMFAVERDPGPGYVLGFAPFDPDTIWKAVRLLGELI